MRVYQAERVTRDQLGLDESKPTVLVVTDSPCIHTGLAKIAREVWGPIHATGKYNVVQLAWWHRDPVGDCAWPLLVTRRNEHGLLDPVDKFGNASMPKVLEAVKPDVIFTSGDPWMLFPITQRRQLINCPCIAYLAVDGGPIDQHNGIGNTIGWAEVCEGFDLVVPYLPWGQDLLSSGFPGARVSNPIPIGVDTAVFRPRNPEKRDELRSKLFNLKPEDKMFMSVSRNQIRKNIPFNILALHFLRSGKYDVCAACGRYNLWRRDYVRMKDLGPEPACKYCNGTLHRGKARRNMFYYMHVPLDEAMEDSWRLADLLHQFDLIKNDKMQGILVNDAVKSAHGVPEEDLAAYYACADAYALPSMGEGFGAPYLEAMACGVKVIATDYSAHPDFLRGIGTLVPCPTVFCEPGVNYWRGIPDTDAWTQAIDENLYGNSGADQQTLQKAASKYDWGQIWPQWLQLIDRCLNEGRSVSVWTQTMRGV